MSADLHLLTRSLAVALVLLVGWLLARRRVPTETLALGLIIFMLTVGLFRVHTHLAKPDWRGDARNMLEGQVDSGAQFRLLLPLVAEGLSRLTGRSLEQAARFLAFITLGGALWAMWFWLSIWFKREGALLGLFLTAAVLPTTFYVVYTGEFADLALCTLVYAVLTRWPHRVGLIALVFTLALLNKETSALLLMPIGLRWWLMGERQRTIWAIVGGTALVAAVQLVISSVYQVQYTHHLEWQVNWHSFCYDLYKLFRHPAAPLNMWLVAGGLWPLALWRFRQSPLLMRLMLTPLVLYLPVGIFIGCFNETRIFHIALAPLVGLIVWQLAPALRREDVPRVAGEGAA